MCCDVINIKQHWQLMLITFWKHNKWIIAKAQIGVHNHRRVPYAIFKWLLFSWFRTSLWQWFLRRNLLAETIGLEPTDWNINRRKGERKGWRIKKKEKKITHSSHTIIQTTIRSGRVRFASQFIYEVPKKEQFSKWTNRCQNGLS